MARISGNEKNSSIDFGDSSQLTKWILDSGATCHMTPEVSDFITELLEDADKYIEVVDGHKITANPKGQVQIKICVDERNTFTATFHNIILAPDLCDGLFLIIMLMNLVNNCLFH